MIRRRLLSYAAGFALTGSLSCPSIGRSASVTTLKFVPYADLALLDPLASALVTRNNV
jgi:peptide/nickel transport system substrate-binding protein